MIIKECHEPLVDLKKACPKLIIAPNFWQRSKEKNTYLRRSMAKRLNHALKYLPKGLTFIINDAWRSQAVQEEALAQFIKKITKRYPHWSKNKIIKAAKQFVAPAQGPRASGHMTGGAVDIRLVRQGRKVPMRSRKLTYVENSQSYQPKLPAHLRKNREIMFQALTQAGLSNHPKEFWHWSYGDLWWAERTGKKFALYGVIEKP